MGDLASGSAGIAVYGDDLHAQALQGGIAHVQRQANAVGAA